MDLYNESTVALLEAFGERSEADPRKRDTLVQAFFSSLQQSVTMLNQAWAEIGADVKKEKFGVLTGELPEALQAEVARLTAAAQELAERTAREKPAPKVPAATA